MSGGAVQIRAAGRTDEDALWRIMEPVVREGDTYALPQDMTRQAALAYWLSPAHSVFAAVADGGIAGSYFIRANQQGGGSHVANCSYMVARAAWGRGVALGMCRHSLDAARRLGYEAIQFNFVVSSNVRAVRLWQSCGFSIVGTIPLAFRHPRLGLVDAYVMHRLLGDEAPGAGEGGRLSGPRPKP